MANFFWSYSSNNGLLMASTFLTNDRIYRSLDNGRSWAPVAVPGDWKGLCISSDGKYQTASSNDIYISTDYGATWTALGLTGTYWNAGMSADGKYQTVIKSTGLYTSSDFGATWSLKKTVSNFRFLGVSSSGQHQIATTPYESITPLISSDYGATWTSVDKEPYENPNNAPGNGCAISGNGQYMLHVFSIFGVIRRSTDYGMTWATVGTAGYWRTASISETGQYQVIGNVNTGGGLISSDYGATWTGIPIQSISISMSGSGMKIFSVKDNGSMNLSTDYGVTWKTVGTTKYWWISAVTD